MELKLKKDKMPLEKESLHATKREMIETSKNKSLPLTMSIGKYVVLSELGHGYFGKTMIGSHSITGMKVIIKMLDKQEILDLSDKARIEREIKLLKTLKHRNIAHLYQVIQRPSKIILVMEYAGGIDLCSFIQGKRQISELEACEIFQQLISGVDYLHKFRIVHRNIKPENIVVEVNENCKVTIKLIDFGLSNTYKKDELLKTQCGSPCYTAPEIILGSKYKGESVDVWSCGITLFNMVSGYMPFSDSVSDILFQKVTEGKYVIPQYFSVGLKNLIGCMLAVDPYKRYKIQDIIAHPWFGLVTPPQYSEGLMISLHIMPIEEVVIKKLKDELKIKPEELRLSILANKHSHATATYYLMLKKMIKEGLESISDMSSKLYKDYIANPRNLLHNYSHDINIIIRERCQDPPEVVEDIRFIPIINVNGTMVDQESSINALSKVSFNNKIEVITRHGLVEQMFILKNESKAVSCDHHHKNTKEKYMKAEESFTPLENSIDYLNNIEDKCKDTSTQSDNNNIKQLPNDNYAKLCINSLNKGSPGITKSNRRFSQKASTVKGVLKELESPKKIKISVHKIEEDYGQLLLSDKIFSIKVNPSEKSSSLILSKRYPKSNNLQPIELSKARGKPYNFKSNFIDTSMSFDSSPDNLVDFESSINVIQSAGKAKTTTFMSTDKSEESNLTIEKLEEKKAKSSKRVEAVSISNYITNTEKKNKSMKKEVQTPNRDFAGFDNKPPSSRNNAVLFNNIHFTNKSKSSSKLIVRMHSSDIKLNSTVISKASTNKNSENLIKQRKLLANPLGEELIKLYSGPFDLNSVFFTSFLELYSKVSENLIKMDVNYQTSVNTNSKLILDKGSSFRLS